jgi:flagellar biosynthesis protein FliP
MMTSFTRIVVVLSLLRTALGTVTRCTARKNLHHRMIGSGPGLSL